MTGSDHRPLPLVLLPHDHDSVVNVIAYLRHNGLRAAHRRNDGDMLADVCVPAPKSSS
jgi:hypothetical protein